MDYNYHTHTYHCHHATGTPEEYILRAIEGGIRYIGFSEHIPLLLSGGSQSGYRMLLEDTDRYFQELSFLKKKYSKTIDIKIGFEVEYYPEYFDGMRRFAKDAGADYMILGQHFAIPEDLLGALYTAYPSDSPDRLAKYTECVISGIRSGVFTYVCHPDVLNFTGEDEMYKEYARKICESSYENNVPLEINFLGIRKSRNYPRDLFWQIAGEVGSPVTFGFDAHTAEDACDLVSLDAAHALCKKYDLNYIGRPTLRPIF